MQVAAGPGFVVEMVNLAARIWRTSPGVPSQEVQTIALGTFFRAGATDRLTDPRVLYDAPSGRWFASISNLDTSSVMLAVSHGADPTGLWSTYSFGASGCADQPRLGLSDSAAVIAADIFSTCDSNFAPLLGGELWVLNKQQLLDGAASIASHVYGPDRSLDGLAPVQSLSPTGTEYAVSVENPSSRVVHLFTIDGVPPGAVQIQQVATASISPLVSPPAAAQPPAASGGRAGTIETNDDRILDSVWENGKLWLAANSGCTPPADTQQHACARVVELSTATKAVDWDTDLSVPGADVFYPAVRPDGAGNLVIVYGESSATIGPELVAVARAPDGTFSTPIVVSQSAGAVSGERYGDYFGAARDPAHPELVWIAGEQGVDVAGTHGWGTTVASVQVNAAVPTPPPPAVNGAAPPRLRAQPVAGRPGTAVRLSYEALDDGTAVREQVTVRNVKKSVVFKVTTAAGRRHLGQVYSVLWRPAKKLRGRFTWCVSSIAPNGKRSAQSCSTVTLR